MKMIQLIPLAIAFAASSLSCMAQIQAGKSVQIMATGIPPEEKGRIDAIYPVSDNGMVNMPFIGLVPAAGMKNDTLAVSLQNRYKSAGIYTNITIQVIANREGAGVDEQAVTVGGQVRKPGPVAFQRGMTLWMAVQASGGPTEFGSPRRVKLFRDGKQKEYDMTKPQFMQIPLEPNDTIEVPEKTMLGR